MKRFFVLVLCAVFLLAGCANQEAYTGYRASFDKTSEDYYAAAKKPLMEIELPSPVEGQPYKITVARDVKFIAPAQIKDSEWVPLLTAGVGIAGIVAGNWTNSHYRSKDIEHITDTSGGGIDTGGGDVFVKDSYNKPTSTAVSGAATTTTGSPVTTTTTEIMEPELELESEPEVVL